MRMLEKIAVVHTDHWYANDAAELAQKFYDNHTIGSTVILDDTNTLAFISVDAVSIALLFERLVIALQRGQYVLIATRAKINTSRHVYATRLLLVDMCPQGSLRMRTASESVCGDAVHTASILDRSFEYARIDYDELVEI